MKPFTSFTGTRVNDPDICIRGMSSFACVCPACTKAMEEAMKTVAIKLGINTNPLNT